MTKLALFRTLSSFVGIYHLVLGLVGLLAPISVVAPVIAGVYKVQPNIDPQFLYLVKFMSAYFIAFGVMMCMVAWKPIQYKHFAYIASLLFFIRILTRHVERGLLFAAFPTMSSDANIMVIIPIALIGLLLIVSMPSTSKR